MRDSRLRLVGGPSRCRTINCDFAAQGELGFCAPCEDVYRTAQALREKLLARRSARLRARAPELFDELPAGIRRRLLDHIAAQPTPEDQGVTRLVGLEDFFADLAEFGLVPVGAGAPT